MVMRRAPYAATLSTSFPMVTLPVVSRLSASSSTASSKTPTNPLRSMWSATPSSSSWSTTTTAHDENPLRHTFGTFSVQRRHYATEKKLTPRPKVTVARLHAKYRKQLEKLTMLTAYDCNTAATVDAAGVDTLLVGDSYANCVLGLPSTNPVTMDAMIHACNAVTAFGRQPLGCMVIGDMPFGSMISEHDVLVNATRFIKEGNCDAVKLEGFFPKYVESCKKHNIACCAHLGLMPQAHATSGFKYEGQTVGSALQLLEQCKAMEAAGAFAVVLECIPDDVAALITEELSIPTIGIGAGVQCSGQVLVCNDVLGLTAKPPKFAKMYVSEGFAAQMEKAFMQFRAEVASGQFPSPAHGRNMKPDEFEKLKALVAEKKEE